MKMTEFSEITSDLTYEVAQRFCNHLLQLTGARYTPKRKVLDSVHFWMTKPVPPYDIDDFCKTADWTWAQGVRDAFGGLSPEFLLGEGFERARNSVPEFKTESNRLLLEHNAAIKAIEQAQDQKAYSWCCDVTAGRVRLTMQQIVMAFGYLICVTLPDACKRVAARSENSTDNIVLEAVNWVQEHYLASDFYNSKIDYFDQRLEQFVKHCRECKVETCAYKTLIAQRQKSQPDTEQDCANTEGTSAGSFDERKCA